MTWTRTTLALTACALAVLLAGPSAADQVVNDDLIVKQSLCTGTDCLDAEDFGFTTIRLKENNLRIEFDDTSSVGPFPKNDWQITINDSASDGASYFAVEDLTAATMPFSIAAGTPTGSLTTLADGTVAAGSNLVAGGRLGVGNVDDPKEDIHVAVGDTPTLRLDQDGSAGWAKQVWDVAANEANFFIRDVTHSTQLPFRVQPGAPSDSLTVKQNGVGIGTWSPDAQLHVIGDAHVTADLLVDGGLEIGTDLATTGNLSAAGATFGGDVSVAGTLQLQAVAVSSSRTLKTDIQAIDRDAALAVLAEIQPVTYRLKADPDEPTAGFIAEDVPDEVATNGRRSINPVEVIAFLTRAVQAQQEVIERQEREQREQQTAFEARLAALEQQLAKSGAR